MLDRHLEQLTKDLSLSPIPPTDEKKQRYLTLSKISIALKDLDPGIYFHSQLAPTPKQKKEELFMLLMKANFLGQGTGDATLGALEDESFLTLSLALPYDMQYKAFKELLENFVNFVDYWQKEIAKMG